MLGALVCVGNRKKKRGPGNSAAQERTTGRDALDDSARQVLDGPSDGAVL